MGLGHVAVRDFISFLRYEKNDENPLDKIKITSAYCFGRSQTGRCIRDSIYLGFNEDLEGRKVFDGVLSHVAGAGKMWLNHRFCNAVVPAGQQYEDHNNIADQFPFSYALSQDHLTGKSDAICKRPKTDPLIFHSQTSTEYWQRRGSLVHTNTQGNDLAMPENVRLYFGQVHNMLEIHFKGAVLGEFVKTLETLFKHLCFSGECWTPWTTGRQRA